MRKFSPFYLYENTYESPLDAEFLAKVKRRIVILLC